MILFLVGIIFFVFLRIYGLKILFELLVFIFKNDQFSFSDQGFFRIRNIIQHLGIQSQTEGFSSFLVISP